jgi:DNA replication protein DnaC
LVEILNSNLSFNLWDEIFSGPAIAILDPHHSTTINIKGKSERGKGKEGRWEGDFSEHEERVIFRIHERSFFG